MLKILILMSKFGLGHARAAEALAERIQRENPGAHAEVLDIYKLAFPRRHQNLYRMYDVFLSQGWAGACKLYNFAYTRTVYKEHGIGRMHSYLKRYIQNCLARYLAENRPDAVISCYSFCSQLMSDYKEQHGDSIPLITCVTDVDCHNLWTNPHTDLYLVAARSTRLSLLAQGAAPERIAVSGIPVGRGFFAGDAEMPSERSRAGYQKELLIMGGGLGMLPAERTFYEQLNRLPGLHTTIIAGRNRKLADSLRGRWEHITVLGFTDRVSEYMRRADLLITKPGGISMFEAIHSELPLLIFTPYLEQEIRNAAFLTNHRMALRLDTRPQNAVPDIAAALTDETTLREMKNNMRRLKEGLDEGALSRFLQNPDLIQVCGKARVS